MRFHLRHILPSAFLLLGCGAEPLDPQAEPAVAEEVMQQQSMLGVSERSLGEALGEARLAGGFERAHVVDDIYHYTLRVKVGRGDYDVITLHRVVREAAPWRPARSPESVMMVHGDAWNFTGAYLSSTLTDAVPREHSIAIYLAKRGVDVWGVDLRWTHVPLENQDFGFMKDWNLGTNARDVGTGLSVARAVRRVTGSGGGKMNLLGWSRGALVGYAYLSAETQLPPGRRQVSGFIPVDMVLKFGPEGKQEQQFACTRAQLAQLQRSMGRYEGGLLGPGAGIGVKFAGQAAIHQPDAIALPPMPPLPNRQLAITLGSATFMFLANPDAGVYPTVPYYHLSAGQFGADGMPVGLQGVQERYFFDVLSHAHPYQSFNEVVEGEQLLCGEEGLPYDDHLAEVKVPVLYVGAGGGFGSYGVHSTTLLGSKDVSVHLVQKLPPEARVADYGHADLFLAADADTAVWAPIHQWLESH